MIELWGILKLIIVVGAVITLTYFIGLFPSSAVFWTAIAITFLHLLFKDRL